MPTLPKSSLSASKQRQWQFFFKCFIKFVTQESAKLIFQGDLNVESIIQGLTAFIKQKLEAGKTHQQNAFLP